MTPEQFVYWLRGYLTTSNVNIATIERTLSQVLQESIPYRPGPNSTSTQSLLHD